MLLTCSVSSDGGDLASADDCQRNAEDRSCTEGVGEHGVPRRRRPSFNRLCPFGIDDGGDHDEAVSGDAGLSGVIGIAADAEWRRSSWPPGTEEATDCTDGNRPDEAPTAARPNAVVETRLGTQMGTATAAEVIAAEDISGGGAATNDGGSDVRGLRRVLLVAGWPPLIAVADVGAGDEAERTRLVVGGCIRVDSSMERQKPVLLARNTCRTAEAV